MVIVQLGGNPNRSFKTLELLKQGGVDTVILSGVENLDETLTLLEPYLDKVNLLIDKKSVDTFRNFVNTRRHVHGTTLLVTDSYHVFRCLGLARIIWRKRCRVVPCPEGILGGSSSGESFLYCFADWTRALIWQLTRIELGRRLGG